MMEPEEIRRGIEAILFAAGDPVGAERMALALGVTELSLSDLAP